MRNRGAKQLTALFIVLVLFMNVVAAQPYPITGKVVDDLRMFFARGDKKAEIALEVREKDINSAIENIKAGNINEAIKELERAKERLELIQKTASPDVIDKVNLSVQEVIDKIMQSKDINPEFSAYLEKHLNEEQKTQFAVQLSDKIFELCEELAQQDYELMLKEPKCDPKNAPPWLRDRVDKEVKKKQQEASQEMINELTTCINDPRDCDCSGIPIMNERVKCEKNKALAIRCEFQNDDAACKELKDMKIDAPSNLPPFLKPFFQKTVDDMIRKKESEMFNKFAPKECAEAGAQTREECESIMFEKNAPRECIEQGAITKEECEKIMIAIYGPPPNECMENGEFIGPERCEEKMVKSGKIPSECIKDGKPIPPNECNKILGEKMGEGGFVEDISTIPKECIKDGTPVPPEECMRIMNELGITPPQPQEGRSSGTGGRRGGLGSQKIPQECVGMTFEECENFIMQKYIPKGCQDSNALTPEECKKAMLPDDCREAGIFTREECDTWKIKQRMPKECAEKQLTNPDDCAKLMSKNVVVFSLGSELDFLSKKGISFEQVPDVCKEESNFVRGMECDEALAQMGITLPAPNDISNIPRECIKDGKPVSPQECREILEKKIVEENIPGPCKEANIFSPEECGKFMEKQRRESGVGIDMPQECFEKSPEECKKIMEEKGIRVERIEKAEQVGMTEREGMVERGEVRLPRECIDVGIADSAACDIFMSKVNEERMKRGDKMIVDKEGDKGFISPEQVNKIVEESERRAIEIQPDTERAEEIKQEIQDIQENIQMVEERAERIELPPVTEISVPATEQPAPSPPSPPAEQAPLTGTIIKNIINPLNLWRDIFSRIASLF